FALAQDSTQVLRPINDRFREQLTIATAAIDSGAAAQKLDEWVAATSR
ncbi:MAG: hypothetical protein JJE28_05225, partial [Actinomycetales bacterium]|nr:hypothetical protein [Actinomycetales bacterium]